MALYRSSNPTARKPHTCDQCSRTIRAGEKYWRYEWRGDDGFESSTTCSHCGQLGRDLFAAGVWGEDPYSGCPCYPYLPEVDWLDPILEASPWPERETAWRAKWTNRDGSLVDYPPAVAE